MNFCLSVSLSLSISLLLLFVVIVIVVYVDDMSIFFCVYACVVKLFFAFFVKLSWWYLIIFPFPLKIHWKFQDKIFFLWIKEFEFIQRFKENQRNWERKRVFTVVFSSVFLLYIYVPLPSPQIRPNVLSIFCFDSIWACVQIIMCLCLLVFWRLSFLRNTIILNWNKNVCVFVCSCCFAFSYVFPIFLFFWMKITTKKIYSKISLFFWLVFQKVMSFL